MAGADRVTIEEVVGKVLRDEHADVIRESVRAVAQKLMEAEVSPMSAALRQGGSTSWSSLGLRISKSEVSRIAGLLDEHVQAFRERPLEGRYPYLFVDAKVEKVRAPAAWSASASSSPMVSTRPGAGRSSAWTSARRRPRRLARVPQEPHRPWLVGRPAGHQRRPPGPQDGAGPGPQHRLAALHRPLPHRLPRERPQGPARSAGRVDPSDLPGRLQ
jgi:Transposase, Mutator family